MGFTPVRLRPGTVCPDSDESASGREVSGRVRFTGRCLERTEVGQNEYGWTLETGCGRG